MATGYNRLSPAQKRNPALVVFVYFEKGFYTINYKIFLSDVRGVANEWLSSYQTNRQQYVSIDDTKSDIKPILNGVPRGSVLRYFSL